MWKVTQVLKGAGFIFTRAALAVFVATRISVTPVSNDTGWAPTRQGSWLPKTDVL